MNRIKTLLTSKTVWGAVLGVASWLYSTHYTTGALTSTDWLQALGMIMSAVGARDAITTSTQPKQ